MPIEEASFQLQYDGPALAKSRMDIRDLAPVLLAISDLVEEADFVVNKGNTSVTAMVSPFTSGCFGIDFTVLQEWSQQAIAGIVPILHVMNTLGFKPKDGLMWLLTKIKGRRVQEVDRQSKDSNTLVLDDGEKIEGISDTLIGMLKDKTIRNALEKTIADPLSKDGINNVNFYDNNFNVQNLVFNIGKPERDYFVAPPELPQTEKRIEEKILKVVGPVFGEENYKWRLAEGKQKQWYDIQDKEFIKKVEARNFQFAAGDSLRVRVCVTSEIVEGNPRPRYEISKVLEIIKPPSQPKQLRIK
jgi:hypothetical protein